MSEQQSPWARPGAVDTEPADFAYPSKVTVAAPQRAPGPLIKPDAGWRSGTVTQLGTARPEPVVVEFGAPRRARTSQQRMLMWFGGGAALIVVIGVVLLLAMAMTGTGPLTSRPNGPSNYAPPLAKACPPPSADAQHLPPAPPPPPGDRLVDKEAGISYSAQGNPWVSWDTTWDAGDLHVKYGVGQHFVTEVYSRGSYHASILSGSVPTAENDALTLDLKCTGHQVLADVRGGYYPQPNTIESMRDEVTTLGGRPAWVAKFRLHFHESGLQATSELVGLALIDVGRPNAAVLYISIPNTVSRYDGLVDQELSSVRPT